MSSLQQDYYRLTLQGNLRDTLLKMGLTGAREVSQQNQTMNLRKVANHPFLFGEPIGDDGEPIGNGNPGVLINVSGKFVVLDRMLRRLKAGGHQVRDLSPPLLPSLSSSFVLPYHPAVESPALAVVVLHH